MESVSHRPRPLGPRVGDAATRNAELRVAAYVGDEERVRVTSCPAGRPSRPGSRSHMVTTLDQTALGHRHPRRGAVSDNDVIVKVQVEHGGGVPKLPRQAKVLP
jgi:hypothetical protein